MCSSTCNNKHYTTKNARRTNHQKYKTFTALNTLEMKTQNTETKTQNTETKTQNTETKTHYLLFLKNAHHNS